MGRLAITTTNALGELKQVWPFLSLHQFCYWSKPRSVVIWFLCLGGQRKSKRLCEAMLKTHMWPFSILHLEISVATDATPHHTLISASFPIGGHFFVSFNKDWLDWLIEKGSRNWDWWRNKRFESYNLYPEYRCHTALSKIVLPSNIL